MNTPRPQSDVNLATIVDNLPDQEKKEASSVWSSLDLVRDASALSVQDHQALFTRIEQTLSAPREVDAPVDNKTSDNKTSVVISPSGELGTALVEDSPARDKKKSTSVLQHLWPPRRLGFVTAAAVLVIAVGVMMAFRSEHLYVPPGDSRQVTLPDGSQVTLNSDSRLTWGRGPLWDRKVDLVGEAFFDVVASDGTFTVLTPDAEISVLGTRFNVRSRSDSAAHGSAVTVLEGTVAFRSLEGNYSVELTSGHRSLLLQGAIRPRDAWRVDEGTYVEWLEGDLIFRDLPLAAAVAEASLRLDVEIRLNAPRAAEISINAAFRSPLSTELILDGLTVPLGLKYRSSVEGFEIYSPDIQPSER